MKSKLCKDNFFFGLTIWLREMLGKLLGIKYPSSDHQKKQMWAKLYRR